MSHLLDQLRFFKRKQGEFANSHGETRHENREWENSYRARWSYDKVVRSTHGVTAQVHALGKSMSKMVW